ncbi:MAG TPA: hypothetical protein VN944_05530 [Nitrospiria bacterium]|nr:hypothetical protein [Nitrospiria bacterium]
MSFSRVLTRVVTESDRATGAAVVANDGIVLEEYKTDPSIDFSILGAEFCRTFREIGEKTASIRRGTPLEISLLTDQSMIILRKINEEYFLVLVLESDANFGKGRFMMRKEMEQLINEFK